MYCSTKGYYLSLFSSNLQVQFFYFKTSHVIVYQLITWLEWTWICISKHLMLLFINYRIYAYIYLTEFQNISCYCLSTESIQNRFRKTISKHLMLLFILEFWEICRTSLMISKHLMLLFIYMNFQQGVAKQYFKTSHVIVYHFSQDFN